MSYADTEKVSRKLTHLNIEAISQDIADGCESADRWVGFISKKLRGLLSSDELSYYANQKAFLEIAINYASNHLTAKDQPMAITMASDICMKIEAMEPEQFSTGINVTPIERGAGVQ